MRGYLRRAAFQTLPASTNATDPCRRFDFPRFPDRQDRRDAEDEKETRSLRFVLPQKESSALASILPRSFERLVVGIFLTSTPIGRGLGNYPVAAFFVSRCSVHPGTGRAQLS